MGSPLVLPLTSRVFYGEDQLYESPSPNVYFTGGRLSQFQARDAEVGAPSGSCSTVVAPR